MIRMLLTHWKPLSFLSTIRVFRALWWCLVATGYTLTGRYDKSLVVWNGSDGLKHCAVLVRPKD
jgi:hypothetical protein